MREEPDHASVDGEAVGLPHREDAAVFQLGENLRQPLALRVADEQDVTLLDLLHAAVVFDAQRPVTRLFTAQQFPQKALERVVAQHSDDHGSFLFREGFGRPFDKLGEVEQERGLDQILLGDVRLRRQVQPAEEQPNRQDPRSESQASLHCRLQNLHVTFP